MARVGLVHRQPEELHGRHREVHVDRDRAAEVAEVFAEGPPRLVAHDLEVDSLAGGEVDEAPRLSACRLDDRSDRLLDALGGHEERVLPAPVALAERAVAGKHVLEALVGGGEDGLLGPARADAVAALHFVGVRGGLTCKCSGVRPQAHDLVAQPTVLELAEEPVRVGDERSRLHRRLRVNGGLEVGRAEVRVDEAVDVAPEPEAEPDVALGGRVGHEMTLWIARAGRRCTRWGWPSSHTSGARPSGRVDVNAPMPKATRAGSPTNTNGVLF